MPEEEEQLSGGNSGASVVRIGKTVRKSVTRCTPTTIRLLEHLHSQGFHECPEALGIDSENRLTLSYIPGDVYDTETLWTSNDALEKTADLLRRFHTATRNFVHEASDVWAYAHHKRGVRDVICHNDFAPYNTIYRDGLPIGIIDFDLCCPGPRLWDVAYCAYWSVPLSARGSAMEAHAIADRANNNQRLKVYCRTYGIDCDSTLLEAVESVLEHMSDFNVAVAMLGQAAADHLRTGGHFDHWKAEMEHFRANKQQLY